MNLISMRAFLRGGPTVGKKESYWRKVRIGAPILRKAVFFLFSKMVFVMKVRLAIVFIE